MLQYEQSVAKEVYGKMEQLTFYRDTWVEINLDSIYNNVANIYKHVPKNTEIIAVVKANGYGHGALQVANEALKAGATSLAVAFLDEALSLRHRGITAPILVLGTSRPQDVDMAVSHDITLTAFSAEWLKEVKKYKTTHRPVGLHLKFDTGMARLGIRGKEELNDFISCLDDNLFDVEGVYTHFATADEVDTTYVEEQYQTFQVMLEWLQEKGVYPRQIHCANSAATLRFKDQLFNAVRVGIIMYGLTPSVEMEPLIPIERKPAFSLHSRVSHVKKIVKGDTVSYGATYKAEEEEWIATIPIGYADGWVRKFQDFSVLINGERVPIVGRVCMDQCMIKLKGKVPVGTQVTLIGKQGDAEVTAEEAAGYFGTINYEVICLISARVPRVYVRNGEIVDIVNILVP